MSTKNNTQIETYTYEEVKRDLDAQAVTDWLAQQYEGPDRYRPNRKPYGIRCELLVRADHGPDEWKTITLKYQSLGQRNDQLERIACGHGLYGQQRRAGRLRSVQAVNL